jgi:L-ascorbate metabolism protein UlaG (beta-lactamase superfamily)
VLRLLRRLGIVLAVLLLITGVVLWSTSAGFATFGGTPDGARLARMQASGRYVDGQFRNREPTPLMRDSGSALSTTAEFTFGNGQMRVPSCPLPLAHDTAERLAHAPASGLRITWLGHSTTLIELDGRVVLTDPIWSERASPSSIAGPKRFHPPPLALAALPHIDAVVVSHDHYDHLDMATVQALAARGVPIHVGLGVGAHLARWGIPPAQILEHDFWQATPIGGGVELVSTPARHFSGRGLFDRNATSWTSWTLVGPTHRVFFSGDTGQTNAFEKIAKRYGPFDLAMLEIGQWNEAWGTIHLGPLGALDAFPKLHAARLLPIHWSTFELALHSWSEPAETLYVNAKKRGVELVTPLLGEPVEPASAHTGPWWRKLPPIAARCP